VIPDGPHHLTADWLSDVLGVPVAEVSVTPVGTGQTGSSYRLSLTYAEDTPLPSTFVAKLAAEDPDVRQRVSLGYRAELAFYDTIATTVKVPVPRCWYSAASEDASSFVLLMSDLSPSVQGDQLAGCTPEAALPGALALAGLHGPRWSDPQWLSLAVTVMPKPDAEGAKGLGDIARLATDLFLDKLGPRMDSGHREVLNNYPDRVGDWLMLRPERFSLLHGDFRLDNLMFAPDGSITVVDWQTLSVGLPGRDLAFFVATSLTPTDRRSAEHALVSAYHDALITEGVTDYSAQECFEDYRIGLLHVLLIATLGWAFSTSTERGDEMMLVMVDRACTAIEDLDAYALVDLLTNREKSAR
jgi:hypothetical protein